MESCCRARFRAPSNHEALWRVPHPLSGWRYIVRISQQTHTLPDRVPLLRRGSASGNLLSLLALRQAVARGGEKRGKTMPHASMPLTRGAFDFRMDQMLQRTFLPVRFLRFSPAVGGRHATQRIWTTRSNLPFDLGGNFAPDNGQSALLPRDGIDPAVRA